MLACNTVWVRILLWEQLLPPWNICWNLLCHENLGKLWLFPICIFLMALFPKNPISLLSLILFFSSIINFLNHNFAFLKLQSKSPPNSTPTSLSVFTQKQSMQHIWNVCYHPFQNIFNPLILFLTHWFHHFLLFSRKTIE